MNEIERPKYNDEEIPDRIRADRIFSAAANPIDEAKAATFAEMIQFGSSPPPIEGYPSTIEEGDIDDYFMNGQQVTEEHVGEKCWNVTDGHHRVIAAIESGLLQIDVTMDQNSFVTIEQLEAWRKYSAKKALDVSRNIIKTLCREWPELSTNGYSAD